MKGEYLSSLGHALLKAGDEGSESMHSGLGEEEMNNLEALWRAGRRAGAMRLRPEGKKAVVLQSRDGLSRIAPESVKHFT